MFNIRMIDHGWGSGHAIPVARGAIPVARDGGNLTFERYCSYSKSTVDKLSTG